MSGEAWSESETLVRVIRDLQSVRGVDRQVRTVVDRSILLLQELAEQAHAGVHRNPRGRTKRNPSLVIFNPVTAFGKSHVVGRVLQVKYEYQRQGFVHDFETEPTMYGIVRNGARELLIETGGKEPLWATQEEVDDGKVSL